MFSPWPFQHEYVAYASFNVHRYNIVRFRHLFELRMNQCLIQVQYQCLFALAMLRLWPQNALLLSPELLLSATIIISLRLLTLTRNLVSATAASDSSPQTVASEPESSALCKDPVSSHSLYLSTAVPIFNLSKGLKSLATSVTVRSLYISTYS